MKNKINSSKKIVVCISNDSYDADIWTNKQHLMSRLSKLEDFFVVYVDQGLSTSYIKKLIKKKCLLSIFKIIQKRNNNLVTVSLLLPLIKGGFLKKISWFLIAKTFNYIFRKKEVIYWIYQPQAYYLTRYLNRGKILYDCVDEFVTQPFYKNYPKRQKELELIEPKLVNSVDFVTTTSYSIYEDKKVINPTCKYIHNVGDFNHFSKPNPRIVINEDWVFDSRCKVLFTGVVDNYKTDLDMILKVASDTRDSHLYVFVGPNRIGNDDLEKKIDKAENMVMLGYRDYQQVPVYLAYADILWLPYLRSSHTERVFPLKIFEYLASGKPVIAKNLLSIKEYKAYLNTFEIFSELKELLSNVLSYEDAEKREQRIKVASQNTWESRLNKILDFIGEQT
ncbi:glycosyltransferase [Saccharicrinis fermentans]|uniref:Putative glycosyl transferase n=1 Tax=Saccharicrinis fermentans DSM 9555 = JCM 21142 TaxID=869213 RepID=W7XVB4_9BACT|nr:glycosyltransferase [Saccharicrinis fermentans]GAF02035.1 putative glycosyl transferase [Saccharicrinis fermentans DSM 9555 = JCM 21142]